MDPWQHCDACVRAAFRVTRDTDSARDIATEVCGTQPTEELPAGMFKGSLLARAKWRAIDAMRAGRLEIVRGYDIERAPSAAPTPEEELIAKQERASLRTRLGEEGLLVLENPEGLTDAELGARLNKSEVAIRQQRSRARRTLIEVE